MCFGFLEAEHIWIVRRQAGVEHLFPYDGANTIHIPGDDAHAVIIHLSRVFW